MSRGPRNPTDVTTGPPGVASAIVRSVGVSAHVDALPIPNPLFVRDRTPRTALADWVTPERWQSGRQTGTAWVQRFIATPTLQSHLDPGEDRAHAAPGHLHELDAGRLRALHGQEPTRRRRSSCVLQRGVIGGPGLSPPHCPGGAPGERRPRAGNAARAHRGPASGATGASVVQAGSPATTPTWSWTSLVERTATTTTRECRARRPCATAPAASAMRSCSARCLPAVLDAVRQLDNAGRMREAGADGLPGHPRICQVSRKSASRGLARAGGLGSLAIAQVALMDARVDDKARAGTFDGERTMVDRALLGDELVQVLDPGQDVEAIGVVDHGPDPRGPAVPQE